MKPSDYLSFDSPLHQPMSENCTRDVHDLVQSLAASMVEAAALVNEQKREKNGDKSGEGNTTIPRNLNSIEQKEDNNMDPQTNGTAQTNGKSEIRFSEQEQRMAATIAAGVAAANRPTLNDAAWTLGKVAVGAAVATSISLAIKKYVFKMA